VPAAASGICSAIVSEVQERLDALGPWHLEVEVAPGVSTRPSPDQRVPFIAPRETFRNLMLSIYPNGLEGRSFLDCACNCGGYSFWAKELGASRCFGFDVREHWIRQANFLQELRKDEEITFEVRNLYDLLDGDPFDITLFKGIFYHLPDPVTGLKKAADMTSELMVISTATRNDFPDNCLVAEQEDPEKPMSGVDGLRWMPTGPEVLERICAWMGFPEVRTNWWRKKVPLQPKHLGRLEMIASRKPGLLTHYDETRAA
jgi:tRNA (mo5U34)-methyltransferase